MHKLAALFAACCVASASASAIDLEALVRDQHGRPLEDAVVVATPADHRVLPPRQAREIVDQVDKEFVPYVKPILVGSLVSFPNKDNIRHHVYSFSPAKRFELPLYSGSSAPPVLFDKPGVVVLGCNIHDWMIGYIYVSESPLFAKTEKDGRGAIREIPPGDYLVRVWHPRMEAGEESTTRRVTLAGTSLHADWQLNVKPEFRIARPVGGKAAGYR